jgi:perosamine synthetase
MPFLPYARHEIDDDDIAAVVAVLRGDWLTTGPLVGRFEEAFAAFVGSPRAVACANGTAALHLCMLAAGIGPGDEVIVPALTFVATANCARYVGAKPVFADVRDDTLTIDPVHVAALVTPRTKAIIAVDYGGCPCDYNELRAIANRHSLLLVADACHAPGATYRGRRVGSIADLSTFSFHPVKHLTTAEGGMVTTADSALADRIASLRNHGIDSDHRRREIAGTWRYDAAELGFNYRLNDVQCALGLSQLEKLPGWVARRREIAAAYAAALADNPALQLPHVPADRESGWHLYPVRLTGEDPAPRRAAAFAALRQRGIGVNVHYLPVYLHSSYAAAGYPPGLCPVAEDAYSRLLSLPMWHGMGDEQAERVAAEFRSAANESSNASAAQKQSVMNV